MKLMSEFREGMWGVALRAVGLLDADAIDPVEQLRRCERLAARPEVERWLIGAAGVAPEALQLRDVLQEPVDERSACAGSTARWPASRP